MANFVLSTHMTNGDVLPFLRIASALVKRGHQATLVTHGVFEPMAAKAGIGFVALDEPEEYAGIMKDLEMWKDPDMHQTYENKYYSIDKFMKEYTILKELCSREDSVLICKERDSYVAMMVSEALHVPIVTVVLAPSYATQLQVWKQMEADITAIDRINDFRKRIGLPPISGLAGWMGTVKKHIGFWHESFDAALDLPDWAIPIETVGFPLADSAEYETLPEDLTTFIQEREPPLLITGGTGKMIKPEFYWSAIEACKWMKRRTILVTRHEEFVHCELPDYIRWYKILPLAGVYPLVSGVINHGGIGTVSAAMFAGTPQLILGADTDRPDNGLRVKNMGVGDYLPPLYWQPQLVAERVEGILTSQTKARCVRLAEQLSRHDTMKTACEEIETLIDQPAYAISSETIRADYEQAERMRDHTAAQVKASTEERDEQLYDEKRAALKKLLLKRKLDKGSV